MYKRKGYKVVNVRRMSRKLEKNSLFIISVVALAVVISLLIAIFASCNDKELAVSSSNSITSSKEMAVSEVESQIVSSSIAKTETSSVSSAVSTSSNAPVNTVTSAPPVSSGAVFDVYASASNWTYTIDKTKPVPLQPKVEDSFFADAMFVGDSITTGIDLYNIMNNSKVIAYTGINTNTIHKSKVIRNSYGTKVLFIDAMKQYNPKHIYIMLGLNGIAFQSKSSFINGYSEFIDKVKAQHPNSVIYIQSILPVTSKKQSSDKRFANSKINDYNAALLQLATQKGVYYLNVAEAFKDSSGNLSTKIAAPDGMHLQPSGYRVWIEYLKRHSVYTGAIPEVSVSSKDVSISRPETSSSSAPPPVSTSSPETSTTESVITTVE